MNNIANPKVIKFGGAIFRSSDSFKNFLELIMHTQSKMIIVLSAFGHTTRNLKHCSQTALNSTLENALKELNAIIDFHIEFASKTITKDDIFNSFKSKLSIISKEISDLLKGINITNEITLRTLDKILSYGEYLAILTVDYSLKENNIDFSTLDYKLLIITDNNFGEAKPKLPETQKRIESILIPQLEKNNIIITQGFVANSITGEKTTMGMESSNLSAILLCKLLDIKDLIIYSDVDSIKTSDPKLIENTKSIKSLDYKSAYKLASSGLNLIFPEMIKIAEENKIQIEYSSVNSTNKTIINSFAKNDDLPILIFKSNLLEIETPIDKWQDLDLNSSGIIDIQKNYDNISTIISQDTINSTQNLNQNKGKNISQLIIENLKVQKYYSLLNSFIEMYVSENSKIGFNILKINYFVEDFKLIIIFESKKPEDFLVKAHNFLILQ